jgi:cathepsin X
MNGVYHFGHKNPLAEFGCNVYEAKDPDQAQCTDIQNCQNCRWNADKSIHCWPITEYTKWWVKEYGSVKGEREMKKEIFARGPLTCGMHVTNKFYNEYKSGIWSEELIFAPGNHAISVVGWGKEGKTEYWIVRNSWGTQFGENGYFRINMHKGSLGIGHELCYWAVPTLNRP